MSLRNQPEFEKMTETAAETTTETTVKEETMNSTVEQKATADVAATTAIAKAATGAVATTQPKAKFSVAFADKNNVLDTATVEGLSLAAPRVKGEQGSFFVGDKDLGSKIRIELISFNHRWAIGTGEQDAEAKDFFRVSYDGETVAGSGGQLVSDYVDALKAQGFAKARVSPYLDVWAFIIWTEKDGDVPVDKRELCCLQCSQTSLGSFTAFATTRGLLESRGLVQPTDIIEVHAEKRISGSNKFTNFSWHAVSA